MEGTMWLKTMGRQETEGDALWLWSLRTRQRGGWAWGLHWGVRGKVWNSCSEEWDPQIFIGYLLYARNHDDLGAQTRPSSWWQRAWNLASSHYWFVTICQALDWELYKSQLGWAFLQLKNVGFREVKWLDQGHTANTWQSGYLKTGLGLSCWLSRKESTCQGRKHRLDPWPGKIPHAEEQLSPCATTAEPTSLGLALQNLRGHRNEKPAHSNYRVAPAHGN